MHTLIAGLVFPYLVAFAPGPAGNPDNIPYAGQPGSVYDSQANPPKTVGVVAYDPHEPLQETGVSGPPPAAPMPGMPGAGASPPASRAPAH